MRRYFSAHPLPSLLLLLLAAAFLGACGGNVITWETASEVNTAGFNLYRGPSATGPWTQINDALVPPASDAVSGGAYSFTDRTAEPGVVYYYQLEEVELDGGSMRFPPTQLSTQQFLPLWAWAAAALAAVGAGWWLGGRWRQRKNHATE